MRKSIRVEEDTHAALAASKGEDETFDSLLTRLLGNGANEFEKEAVSGKEPTRQRRL